MNAQDKLKHENDANVFCHTCGEYTNQKQRKRIIETAEGSE